MKLRYETGAATLVQFAVGTILGFLTQFSTVVASCFKHSGDCVSDTLTSLLYVILLGMWLGFVSVIGYAAQDKRSQRLAQILVGLEGIILLVILFNIRGSHNLFDQLASLIDLAICIWVVMLAWRLMRAKGGRIVKIPASTHTERPRRRVTRP